MAVSLDEHVAALPRDERAALAIRVDELRAEVASLKALRALSGKAQVEVARRLGIKQPSVSKIERQADLYLSTLRAYVEAVGGELELVVKLPGQAPVRLERLGPEERSD